MNIVRTVFHVSFLVTPGAETMPHLLHLLNVLRRFKPTSAKLGLFQVTPTFAPILTSILCTQEEIGSRIKTSLMEAFGTLNVPAQSILSMEKPLIFRISHILWDHSLSA
jgi:hypothetical protein